MEEEMSLDDARLALARASVQLEVIRTREGHLPLSEIVEFCEEEFMTEIHVHGGVHICFMDFSREKDGMNLIKNLYRGYVRVVHDHTLFQNCPKNLLQYPVRTKVLEEELKSSDITIKKEERKKEMEDMKKKLEAIEANNESLNDELTMLKKLLRLEVGEKRFVKVLQALEILK